MFPFSYCLLEAVEGATYGELQLVLTNHVNVQFNCSYCRRQQMIELFYLPIGSTVRAELATEVASTDYLHTTY